MCNIRIGMDRAFILVDFIHQDLETAIHDLVDFLGIYLLTYRCVIGHICEKHCHQLPFAFNGTSSGEDLLC